MMYTINGSAPSTTILRIDLCWMSDPGVVTAVWCICELSFWTPPPITVFQSVTINIFHPALHLMTAELITLYLFLSGLLQQLDPFTAQTYLLLSVLLIFNFLSLWVIRLRSDAPSLLFSARRISGVYLFPSENESVKLVSLSERVIITSPERRWWMRQMGCKVFHSGCQTAKCEIQNVFHLLGFSLLDVLWTPVCCSGGLMRLCLCCECMRVYGFCGAVKPLCVLCVYRHRALWRSSEPLKDV